MKITGFSYLCKTQCDLTLKNPMQFNTLRRKGSKLELGCLTSAEAFAHARERELNRISVEVNVTSRDKQLSLEQGRHIRAWSVSYAEEINVMQTELSESHSLA